ncbi:MAG: NAD(P)-dependent oxidoreductase [Syntrophaceticus sp.]
MNIGFIGIGAMGRPMAVNLLKAGFHLTVYDLNQEAVQQLVEMGACSAATPKELAAGADVVITMLPNFGVVQSVLGGADGVLAGIRESAVIIDMSTVAPNQTRRMAALAKEKGVSYLDAPVSGGVGGAAKGALTSMVGGPAVVIDQVMGIFNVLGKKVYRVGDVGAGDAIKLVNNLLLGVNMAAVAEAMVVGVKAGLDPQVLLEIISSSSGNSYALETKMPNFVMKGNFEPGFAINLQFKDLELATQTGKDLGVPLFLTNLTQQIFEQARAVGLGGEDISAVIKVWEKLAGVEVRD